MELIFGTTNQGKLNLIRSYLEGSGIRITGLTELPELPEEPVEYGKTPLENARGKAEHYYRLLKRPVFSCDSGLVIEGLSDEEQPGVHVRRHDGIVMTDAQMTEYYSGIAARFGGKCIARYQNGICVVFSDTEKYEYDGPDISGESFYLVERAKPQKEAGFPLDCISVDIKTGLYFVDDGCDPGNSEEKNGFRLFLERVLREHEAARTSAQSASEWRKK